MFVRYLEDVCFEVRVFLGLRIEEGGMEVVCTELVSFFLVFLVWTVEVRMLFVDIGGVIFF